MGGIVNIALAVVGVAIIGVIFTSKQTASIINAAGSNFSNAIGAAVPKTTGG